MRRIYLTQRLGLAINIAGRVYFCPPDADTTWKLVSVAEVPDIAITAHDTNYVTRSLVKGASTALNTPTTSKITGGVAVVQGTPIPATLTAVGTDLEITQAAPMRYEIAHSGAGVACEMSIVACFEVIR